MVLDRLLDRFSYRFRVLVLFLFILVIPTCGRLNSPAPWSTLGSRKKVIDWLINWYENQRRSNNWVSGAWCKIAGPCTSGVVSLGVATWAQIPLGSSRHVTSLHDSTRRTCRVLSFRDVTSQVEFRLYDRFMHTGPGEARTWLFVVYFPCSSVPHEVEPYP